MPEPTNQNYDPFPYFRQLSPVTQDFIVLWALSPWTVEELLEDEPEREVIVREIKKYDLLFFE